MAPADGSPSIPVSVLVDRLTSASLPSDAADSLTSLASSAKSPGEDGKAVALDIAESREALGAICSLLSSGRLPPHDGGGGAAGGMEVEDGPGLCCELLMAMLGSVEGDRKGGEGLIRALLSPPGGEDDGGGDGPSLMDALLDLLCPSDDAPPVMGASTYARVLSMQILRLLSSSSPSLTQSKLLRVPDGLNRLVDLLHPSTPEEIRNEAILLAADLARASSASARLIIFGEGYEKSLSVACDAEGGLRGGSHAVVGDCVRLCLELTRNDSMGAEVLLGSAGLLDRLAGLLDLREGRRFRIPDAAPKEDEGGAGGGDDLDDILKGGDEKKPEERPVPYLTEGEETVMGIVVDLIESLLMGQDDGEGTAEERAAALKKKQSRQKRLVGHDRLCRLVLDLALFAHPPPGANYLFGAPSVSLRCRALEVVAALGRDADPATLEGQGGLLSKPGVYLRGVGVLDRAMYLICTGGGALPPPGPDAPDLGKGKDDDEDEDEAAAHVRLSVHALSVLRAVLTPQAASLQLLHTLAPPMMEDPTRPPPVTEVRRLVNTLSANLHFLAALPAAEPEKKLTPKEERDSRERRAGMVINAIGSASALGVFLTNGAGDTTREMLLRVPVALPPPPPPEDAEEGWVPPPPRQTDLMECALNYLEATTSAERHSGYDPDVAATLLRLLAEWVPSAPPVIHSLLSSPSSVALGMMLKSPPGGPHADSGASDSAAPRKAGRKTVQALTGLILGLCMEYLGPEDEVGGWSRSGLMNLISSGVGIGRYTSLLEGLKGGLDGTAPWARCESEAAAFGALCGDAVRVVRKRAVQELTSAGGSGDADEDEEDGDTVVVGDGAPAAGGGDSRSMARLLSRQSSEIEELRSRLEEAERANAGQASQLRTMKRRLESNPTQLDEMMDEMSSRAEEVERANLRLKEQMEAERAVIEERLRDRDAELEGVREEMRRREGEVRDVTEERDSLRSEMEGLAAAYASLEGEYHRLRGEGNGTATETEAAAPTGEAGDEGGGGGGQTSGTQAEGDETTEAQRGRAQASSDARTEEESGEAGGEHGEVVASLRTENAKLRNDVRAANDWMRQAVQRMEEQGQRIQVLEVEAHSLRTALEESGGEGAASAATAAAVAEASGLRDRLAATESELAESRSANNALEEELGQLGEELAESCSQGDELRSRLERMEVNLAEAEEEIRALQARQTDKDSDQAAEHQILTKLQAKRESILEKKEAEIQSLRESLTGQIEEIQGRLQGELQARDKELSKLKGEFQKAEEEANRVAEELERRVREREEDIKRKESSLAEMEGRVRELEAAGEGQSDTARDTLLVEAREEAAKLRSANKAAQEWMKNAVAHHQNLGKEVEALKQKNGFLTAEVETLRAVAESAAAGEGDAAEQLRASLAERDGLRTRVESLERELSDARDAGELTAGAQAEELRSVRARLSEREGRIQALEENLARMEAASLEDLTKCQGEVVALQARLGSNIAGTELESTKAAISDRDKTIQSLREELGDTQDEVDNLTTQVGSLEEQLDHAEETARQLLTANASLVEKDRELERLRREAEELQGTNEELAAEKASLVGERDAGLATIGELRGRLAEFQAWTETAQQRIAELESEKDAAEGLAQELEKSEEGARQDAEAARDELQREREDAQKRLDALMKEKGDAEEFMTQEMEQLQAKVCHLETDKGNLEGRNRALMQDLKVLEGQNSELTVKVEELNRLRNEVEGSTKVQVAELKAALEGKGQQVDELEEQLFEKESALADVEGDMTVLTKELEDLRGQSEDAIKQWQERAEELESKVDELEESLADLHSQMNQQEEGANEAISQWEDRCNMLSEQADAAEEAQEEAEGKLAPLEEQVVALRRELETKKESLDEVIERLSDEHKSKEVDLAERRKVEEDLRKQLEMANASIEEQCGVIEEQEDALKSAEEQIEALTKELEETREQSEEVVNQWEERVAELETTIEIQHEQANAAIESWEARCNALSEQIDELETQVGEEGWGGEDVVELRKQIETCKESMKKKDVSLEEALAQIQLMGLELTEAKQRCEEIASEKIEYQKKADEATANIALKDAELTAVEAKWRERNDQLMKSQHKEWEARCNVLSKKIEELEKQVAERGWEGEKIVQLERHIEKQRESDEKKDYALEEAGAQIQSIRLELTEVRRKNDEVLAEKALVEAASQKRAEEAVAVLAAKHLELQAIDAQAAELSQLLVMERDALAQEQASKRRLEEVLEAERVSRDAAEKRLAVQLEAASSSGKELEELRAQASTSFDEYKSRMESQLQKLQDGKQEAEAVIQAERHNLEEQTRLWEGDKQVIEENIAKMGSELEMTKTRLGDLQKAKGQVENQLEAKSEELHILKEEAVKLRTELAAANKMADEARSLKMTLDKERQEWEEVRQAHQEKLSEAQFEELQKSKLELEAELGSERQRLEELTRAFEDKQRTIAELESFNRELQDELQEANEALKSHVTDEVSFRATKMASDALRAQINEIRSEQNDDRKALENEHQLRCEAEEEVQRLRSLLSQGVPGEFFGSHAKTLSSKGDNKILKMEREEIEEIRRSLCSVMAELNSARASARDAEERATNAKLQASVFQKEALGAKSDLALLRQTTDELRESETNARASLEYRISALEDDREVLTRSHMDEVEGLKAELSQVNMEKERLMHTLAESEKANAALVYATSVQSEQESASEEAAELAQLRLERAQLLAAATEVGARTERRIREAVAASAASIEAELILERELRQAAESIVEDVQAQMEDLKERAKSGFGRSPLKQEKDIAAEKVKKLENELRQLKAEIMKVKGENRELKNKLEKNEADAKATVIKLTEKCRHAETKAREIEREGRFEAAVAAEITRLRAEYENPAEDQLGGEDTSPAGTLLVANSDRNGKLSAEGVHDFVMELKKAIKDERQLYHELLSEHEDLLALVAQQDLENASLNAALARIGGQGAVDEALKEAESKAVNDFGTYIRLR